MTSAVDCAPPSAIGQMSMKEHGGRKLARAEETAVAAAAAEIDPRMGQVGVEMRGLIRRVGCDVEQ